MTKILLTLSILMLSSCTLPWGGDHYEHPNLSGEVPPAATTVDGYEYPAIPLDEFNQMNQSGSSDGE